MTISDCWKEAEEGKTIWTHDGDGVYFAACSDRPYIGEHDGDFLMAYLSKEDLKAPSITAYSAIAREKRTIKKPPYGFAFAPHENRVYVRLRHGADPNGQSIKFTRSFARPTVTAKRCRHLIIDGFVIEGAGNIQAVHFDDACADVTVRNCVFHLVRHGVRCPSRTILEACTYRYVGFDRWTRDLFALDGTENNGVFVLVKGYYRADAVGVGKRANALLEGSLDFGRNITPPATDIVIDRCLIGPAFDGSRIGEFSNSEIKNTVFVECRDDGFQNEGPKKKLSADNNRIHDCRFINCYHDCSHQKHAAGNAFVFRNVIEWNDSALAIPDNFSIKMIGTSPNVDIFYYHNTWIIDYGVKIDGQLRLWADFGGPKSKAHKIDLFMNNIVIVPEGLSDGPGPNPITIAANATVGPSAEAAGFLTVNGGVYAGAAASEMGLDQDLALLPIARRAIWANRCRQAFRTVGPDGAPMMMQARSHSAKNRGPHWPRPATLAFDEGLPGRWSSPGS